MLARTQSTLYIHMYILEIEQRFLQFLFESLIELVHNNKHMQLRIIIIALYNEL